MKNDIVDVMEACIDGTLDKNGICSLKIMLRYVWYSLPGGIL